MKKNVALKIVGWVVFGLLAAGAVLALVFSNYIFGAGSIFNNVVSDNDVVQYLWSVGIPAMVRTIQIVVVVILVNILLNLIGKIKMVSQKAKTIFLLLLNFVKWAVAIAAFLIILMAWGASATITTASAGIIALIIGLGSQALVADILAGIFIVFEGDFQAGDIVIIDGWRGEVQAIGIRTTKLMDAGGNIKIVNNSDIRSIVNQTKDLSIAKCTVGVCYEDRLENIEAVIADNLDSIKEKIPQIIEGPFYKGVSELADSSVNLLFVAKCKESDIYTVQRSLNREIKIMFDNNNIGIPFPQVVVHMGEDDKKESITKKTVKKAEEFVNEQGELSKDIDVRK